MNYNLPYVKKCISNISQSDKKIAIVGNIIEIDEKDKKIKIDDGTGVFVGIYSDDTYVPKEYAISNTVRLFGNLSIYKDGSSDFIVHIIQTMSGLDMELYKQIYNK